jgi:hypothetical protein
MAPLSHHSLRTGFRSFNGFSTNVGLSVPPFTIRMPAWTARIGSEDMLAPQ